MRLSAGNFNASDLGHGHAVKGIPVVIFGTG
jgi:hypothetical protein